MQRRNGLPLPFLIVVLYALISRRCSSCSVSFMALRQFPINATYLELQGDSRAGRGEK
jgi:hypothetical protein